MESTSITSYSTTSSAEREATHLWNRHPILVGGFAGLTWGIAMRLWMRFISTDPEFSWSGTGFIIGAALIVGLSLGAASAARRRTRGGWWRLLGLPVIFLGAGAGVIMLPGTLLGGLAFGRRHWPRPVRLVLGILALGGTAVLVFASSDFVGPIKTTVALAAFIVLHTIEMAALGIVFATPRREA